MMGDQEDAGGDLPFVEQMRLTERLKQAKKQRAMQLKAYEQREKRFAKEEAAASKKAFKKSKTVSIDSGEIIDKSYERQMKIRFADSTLLMDAVGRNDVDEVKRLLAAGVNPNITGIDGLTALHQSCIDNALDMVRLLVESGADVNARDVEHWTPMHAAATCGHYSLCRYLCEHGADLLAMNTDGNMPYDLCDDVATLDFIETEMTRQGVTQDLIDQTRLTCENQMLADLKQISESNGDLEYRGANGETPLHIAASCGYLTVVQFLVSHRVHLDVIDNDSWQPIHCASCWSQPNVVELLLLNGVDPEAKTASGQTVLDLCEDVDIKLQILEIMDAVKNKRPQMICDTGHGTLSRRTSSARRSSIASPASIAWQRRSSLHDRRDSISLREVREEAKRLRDTILYAKDSDEDDEEHNAYSPGPANMQQISFEGENMSVVKYSSLPSAAGDHSAVNNANTSASSIPTSSGEPGQAELQNGRENERQPVVAKSIIKKTAANGLPIAQQGMVSNGGKQRDDSSPQNERSAGNVREVAEEPKQRHKRLCCVVS